MLNIENRVTNLETALVQYMKVVGTAQAQTEKEMREFKDEMRGFKDEMGDFQKKAEKDREELFKKLVESSDRMGRFLEDFVAPNIPTIAKEFFGVKDLEYSSVRIFKVSAKDRSFCKEFDTIAAGNNKLIVNETKCTPRDDYINNFKDGLKNIFDYFPEYSEYEIIPIFSTLYFPDNTLKYLTKLRIYAMGVKGDAMTILNSEFIRNEGH